MIGPQMPARALIAHRLPLTQGHHSKKECAMSHIVRVVHTAKTATRGGREYGTSRSSDGLLDISLSIPGSARIGTNPEQLFAAAWSASLQSAIALLARQRKTVFPVGLAIEAEVDLCLANGAYFLQARLNFSLPGVEREVAQALVDEAHETCAYSKATRGNIDVAINLV
jgi:lipoyl-dependent peroxiredoxin